MKRIVYKLALVLIAGTLIGLPVMAQETSGTRSTGKSQKEAIEAKKAEEERQKEIQLKEEQKLKVLKEKEIQQKEEAAKRAEEYARQAEKNLQERLERVKDVRVRNDSLRKYHVYVISDSLGTFSFKMPEMPDIPELTDIPEMPDYGEYYSISDLNNYNMAMPYHFESKSGSSWNYSRRLLEASFSSDYSMGADESAEEVSLSISGDCAEGAILISIFTPDGNKLSEVTIDENGSMNWHKSFNTEETKWPKGNWVFKINAKNATGKFNISMSAY